MNLTTSIKNSNADRFYNLVCNILPVSYQVEIKKERKKLDTIFVIEVRSENENRTIKNIARTLNR